MRCFFIVKTSYSDIRQRCVNIFKQLKRWLRNNLNNFHNQIFIVYNQIHKSQMNTFRI